MPQIDGVSKKKESQLPNAEQQLEGKEPIFQGTICWYGISAYMDANDGRCLFANQEERIQGLTVFFFHTCQGSICFVKGGEEEVVPYSTQEDVHDILCKRGNEFTVKGPNGFGDDIFFVVKGNLLYHTFEL